MFSVQRTAENLVEAIAESGQLEVVEAERILEEVQEYAESLIAAWRD